ncbi:hypothetical protein ACFV0C_23765 [Streptomyces sp. NPDC059568]|uniref:hypothetical protein n=1 Tax=Streptomyces sp. NPDC059568 TaxID=3346868 RepID=UPI0036861B3F
MADEVHHDHVVSGERGVRRPVPQLLPDLVGSVVLTESRHHAYRTTVATRSLTAPVKP